MAKDDIKFVKENSLAAKPITAKDLDKPSVIVGFMKNEKGSGGQQTKGNIIEIKKRGDVYDIYTGDELRPSQQGISKEEILRLYSQEATSGYMYKAESKADPKLSRWIDIDDEDIYTNRLVDLDPDEVAKKGLPPLQFIDDKATNKPVADLDPKTATLREVAQAYADKSGRGKTFMGPALQYFRDIADEPGSALRLFEKDAEGNTLLSKTFKGTEDVSTVKTAMQNLRQVGLTLKEMVGPDTPEYKLLPDKAPNTDLNNRIFGRSEPAKAVSVVAINPDKAKMSELFAGVSKYLDDPKTRPIAQAIIFNLNTGLRPNAAAGLQVNAYKPDSGAIYIEAETKGAKGRAVNIPLNPIADSILQENLAAGNKENFFVKPNGKVVTSNDMTDLLKDVKVKDIAFDAATGKYFDSLAPAGFSGKKGSALLRNIHATVGQSIGIDQDRLAYLQGRSLKSAGKSSTGELTTYQQAFPGAVGEVDRQNANMFAQFWGDAAQEAGFDIQTKIPMPETRITTQTAGYEGYFDLPVREEVPAASQPTTAPASVDEAYPGMAEKAAAKGVDLNKLLSGMADKLGSKLKTAVPLAAGIELGRQFIDAPLATAGELAKEVGLEGAARVAGFGAAPAAAVPMALAATPTAGPELSEMPPQRTDFIPAPEVEETDEDRMARIATEDAGFIPEAAPAEQQGFLSR